MEPEILEARYTHQEIVRKYNWIAPIYDLFGCRGVMARPFLERIGFREFHREFVSQLRFPSEVVSGMKRNGSG